MNTCDGCGKPTRNERKLDTTKILCKTCTESAISDQEFSHIMGPFYFGEHQAGKRDRNLCHNAHHLRTVRYEFPPTVTVQQALEIMSNGDCAD